MNAQELINCLSERQASELRPFLFPVFGYVYPLRRLTKLLAGQLASLIRSKHAVLTKRERLV